MVDVGTIGWIRVSVWVWWWDVGRAAGKGEEYPGQRKCETQGESSDPVNAMQGDPRWRSGVFYSPVVTPIGISSRWMHGAVLPNMVHHDLVLTVVGYHYTRRQVRLHTHPHSPPSCSPQSATPRVAVLSAWHMVTRVIPCSLQPMVVHQCATIELWTAVNALFI